MFKSLGAIHFVYNNIIASEEAIKSFRNYHTKEPYIIVSDGGVNYNEIAKKYNCDLIYSPIHIGYPPYNKDYLAEYFNRFFVVCARVRTSHLILMEDDIHVANEINFLADWEIAGYNGDHNEKYHPALLKFAYDSSGVAPEQNWYGGGGGSIFKVDTYLKTYFNFINFYLNNFEYIKNNFQNIAGWPDFATTLLYLAAGKKYTINPRLHEIKDRNFDEIYSLKEQFDIFHHYKRYY